eukprot:jgi/Ulvmu1/11043/UM007_0224.1
MSESNLTEESVIAALGLADGDIFAHAPMATAAEQVSALASEGCQDSDRVAKNLFLKDNRNRLYLCTALHTTAVPFEKTLAVRLGLKKNELRMAPSEAMLEALKVGPGCATPLATGQPSAERVTLLLDQSLHDAPFFVHPLTNTKSLRISAQQLEAFLADRGRKAHWVDFGITDVKVGPNNPPDLKAIADLVPEMKVKAEATQAAKGSDAKKDKKAAKAAQKGPAAGKGKASDDFDPSSVKCCLSQVMRLVEAATASAVAQQKPLTELEKLSLERDVEMYLSSLQNSSFAAGLASGRQTVAALALGQWK